MTARQKSALLWGVVGALLFLVLHQGYLLFDGEFLGVGPVAGVAVAVFAATSVASYYTAGHLEVFESAGALGADQTNDAGTEDATASDEAMDDEADEWIWGGEE